MTEAKPYHVEYDGYYAMSWHDQEANALKRWFENYKIEKYASFASDTEWLVVKELPSERRCKKRLVCEIGDDGRGTKREVIIDHTAPPAPVLTFAAKRLYVPPPPPTPAELRKHAEWSRMMARGYEPIYRPKRRYAAVSFDPRMAIPESLNFDDDCEVEWVPRRRLRHYDEAPVNFRPPPPTHRRNV